MSTELCQSQQVTIPAQSQEGGKWIYPPYILMGGLEMSIADRAGLMGWEEFVANFEIYQFFIAALFIIAKNGIIQMSLNW